MKYKPAPAKISHIKESILSPQHLKERISQCCAIISNQDHPATCPKE